MEPDEAPELPPLPPPSINEPPIPTPPPLPPFPVNYDIASTTTFMHRFFFDKNDLEDTPSTRAGIPPAWEAHYRRGCSMFITRVCINLKAPHVIAAAANDFAQRFYMHESLVAQDRFTLCCAAVLLAGLIRCALIIQHHYVRTVKMCEAGAVRLKELIPVAWHVYCEATSLDASKLSDEAFIEKLRTRVVLAERHILATLNFPIFDARRDFAVPMVWKMADFYRLEHTAPDPTTTPVPAGLNIAKTAVNILLDLCVLWTPHLCGDGTCVFTGCTHRFPSSSAPTCWQRGRCGWHGTCCAQMGPWTRSTWAYCGMSMLGSQPTTCEVCMSVRVSEPGMSYLHRCGALLLCALHAAAWGWASWHARRAGRVQRPRWFAKN